MAYTKLALKRDENTPTGQPAPMHLDCPCGGKVSFTGNENKCACGAVYDNAGWVIIPSSASRTEAAAPYASLGRSIPDAF